ncbi:nitric oxide reductase activation protein NorD [Actinomycetospora sp. TBRC 11914]|uniref:nitric oxide reductase activation protein NorD n=1 Tax=Actinomycetospora sp. TBRC 11914 TaxID=2729387 RepID=UPI00145D569E|nr:hypothetical protein [Actinomycetospora sp. TBRC 11914]NMO91679.1 hypothetical protein [Actinomycetospora sp. TBRC 11914]
MAEGPEGPGANDRPDLRLRRLTLLAGAIAGRRMHVRADDVARAWNDRETVVLPTAQLPTARRTVVLQAALVAVGSLDSRPMRALTRCRPGMSDRFLVLEAARAASVLADLLPRSVLSDLAATVGDLSVPVSVSDSLERARSDEALPGVPEWYGRIRARALARSDAEDAGETGGVAPSDRDHGGTAGEQAVDELDDEEAEDAETGAIMQKLQVRGMKNPFTAALQKLLGMGAAPSSDENPGAAVEDLPVGNRRQRRIGHAAGRLRTPPALASLLAPRRPTGTVYPEWDRARGRYRPDWCTVTEFDPPSPSGGPEDRPPASEPDPALRRELARLSLHHERRRRCADGDSLDLTALVDHRIAVAAGDAGDPDVCSGVRRTGRDLAVLVLLDATGSVGEGDVFAEQVEVAARLSAGLEQVGDRVATYGFSSRGRRQVRMLRVKAFDDRWDAAARRRMSALSPSGHTRLGAAVRHGTHVLATRGGTSNLLLVVVGDGLPHDDEYTGVHAQEDSRMALDEAALGGIGCVGISVRGSGEPEALARVWGEHQHRPLGRYPELVAHLRPMVTAALRNAAAGGRRSVRARAGAGP